MAVKELIKNKKYQIIVSYRDEDNEPRNVKPIFYGTHKEAILEEARIYDQMNNGIDISTNYKKLFDEYIEIKKIDVAEETIRKEIELYDKYLKSISNKKAESFTYKDVISLRGKIDKIGGAVSQKNKAIYLFKRISKHGYKAYDFEDRGKDLSTFKAPLSTHKIHPTLTPEEFNYVNSFEKKPVYNLLNELYFWTGLRRGCALALFKQDLLDTKEIDIYNSINNKGELGPPKNKYSYRKVLLHDELYEKLLPYKDNPGLYLLGDHKNLAPSTVNRRFKETQEKANTQRKKDGLHPLPYVKIHDLRHSHATFLASIGVPIAAISDRLGHSSVFETLNTYTHLFRGDDAKVVASIGDYLNEKKSK